MKDVAGGSFRMRTSGESIAQNTSSFTLGATVTFVSRVLEQVLSSFSFA